MKKDRGYYPTKDGKFKGRIIECAICGQEFRRYEMIYQNGYLVCKKYCYDEPGHKPK